MNNKLSFHGVLDEFFKTDFLVQTDVCTVPSSLFNLGVTRLLRCYPDGSHIRWPEIYSLFSVCYINNEQGESENTVCLDVLTKVGEGAPPERARLGIASVSIAQLFAIYWPVRKAIWLAEANQVKMHFGKWGQLGFLSPWVSKGEFGEFSRQLRIPSLGFFNEVQPSVFHL